MSPLVGEDGQFLLLEDGGTILMEWEDAEATSFPISLVIEDFDPPFGEILVDMPNYYVHDRVSTSIIHALSNEIARVQATANAIRRQFFVKNADDTYGLLATHEFGLGIATRPEGKSVAQRQATALAAVQRRFSPRGKDWRAAVSAALGLNDSDWDVIPHYPNDYDLTMVVPFAPGTVELDAVIPLLEVFTPANLNIVTESGSGFIVGVSDVGEEVI